MLLITQCVCTKKPPVLQEAFLLSLLVYLTDTGTETLSQFSENPLALIL